MSFFKKINVKKLVLYLFLFILVFGITFVVSYICLPCDYDEIWLYGFSFNISKGLVIYRDFNVVTTPLYYMIGSLFIKIFGNYIIVMGVFNSILVAFIFLMMFRVISYKAFIVFPLILIFYPNGYNLLCLFWLMLILLLVINKKDDDILVAFILGLLFITKQNIGLCLLIPYLYYSKKKIKGLICFFVPFVLVSIYLIYNNAFYEFIDYCFLGMLDFGTGNSYFCIFSIIEIFVLGYLIFLLLKSKFCDKEVFYILMFQIMLLPLSDPYHFFVSFFPVTYYIVKKMKNQFILIWLFFIILLSNIYLFFVVDHEVYENNDILYLKNCGDLPVLMNELHEYLDGIDYYYFVNYYGYLYKLYYDIPITQYDLWNEGNMGYKGLEKRINEVSEMCEEKQCLFFVDGDWNKNGQSQIIKFADYIVNNYEFVEEFHTFLIYSNNK